MPTVPNANTILPPASGLELPLRKRGFVRDNGEFRLGALSFAERGRWLAFHEPARERGGGPLIADVLGQPGLWKRVDRPVLARRVFEIPSWAVFSDAEEARSEDEASSSLEEWVDWVLESRDGRTPNSWQPPDKALVLSWIPRGALTVHINGSVRQGELVLDPASWALRMPILPQVPDDLPEPRRRALEDLFAEAQVHWAMVRFGVPAGKASAGVLAEVNLTGAPHSEPLFSAGLSVITQVATRLVEIAGVLSDPSLAIACLAPGQSNKKPKKGVV
ncbi:MAG: hypothetical protein AB9869_30950 [Verrucomicrobiia bacterium]